MTTLATSGQTGPIAHTKRIPGDAMIWLFLLGDMICFAMFFLLYSWCKLGDPELYTTSQQALNLHTGSLNTILLLASSWFVVLALRAAQRNMASVARWFMVPAFLCGLGFALVKGYEYYEKSQAGIGFLTNDFYLFYYLITGMHYAHILLGLPLLLWYVFALRKDRLDATTLYNFESSAIFWHMVDLLWIIIFPLIYLVQ